VNIKSKLASLLFIILLLFIAAASPAQANIGVPMIFVIAPSSWVLLLLIIPIEAVVGICIMRQPFVALLKVSAKANAFSTIVGIPITWALLTLIEMIFAGTAQGVETPLKKIYTITVQSPWLIPYESEFRWMGLGAAAFLCIPFFFMSVWCERWIANKNFVDDKSETRVNRWIWTANIVTYGIIFTTLVIATIISL